MLVYPQRHILQLINRDNLKPKHFSQVLSYQWRDNNLNRSSCVEIIEVLVYEILLYLVCSWHEFHFSWFIYYSIYLKEIGSCIIVLVASSTEL
jgi:hypothetical protein